MGSEMRATDKSSFTWNLSDANGGNREGHVVAQQDNVVPRAAWEPPLPSRSTFQKVHLGNSSLSFLIPGQVSEDPSIPTVE